MASPTNGFTGTDFENFKPTYQSNDGYNSNQYLDSGSSQSLAKMLGGNVIQTNPSNVYGPPAQNMIDMGGADGHNAGLLAKSFASDPQGAMERLKAEMAYGGPRQYTQAQEQNGYSAMSATPTYQNRPDFSSALGNSMWGRSGGTQGQNLGAPAPSPQQAPQQSLNGVPPGIPPNVWAQIQQMQQMQSGFNGAPQGTWNQPQVNPYQQYQQQQQAQQMMQRPDMGQQYTRTDQGMGQGRGMSAPNQNPAWYSGKNPQDLSYSAPSNFNTATGADSQYGQGFGRSQANMTPGTSWYAGMGGAQGGPGRGLYDSGNSGQGGGPGMGYPSSGSYNGGGAMGGQDPYMAMMRGQGSMGYGGRGNMGGGWGQMTPQAAGFQSSGQSNGPAFLQQLLGGMGQGGQNSYMGGSGMPGSGSYGNNGMTLPDLSSYLHSQATGQSNGPAFLQQLLGSMGQGGQNAANGGGMPAQPRGYSSGGRP